MEGNAAALSASGPGAVVITGASTGIGEACALHLDRLGFHVFAGVRRADAGEALRRRASPRLTPLQLDVTDAHQLQAAVETVTASLEAMGPAGSSGQAGLIGLVNNAGIAVAGPLEFLPLDDVRRQLEVNVVGVLASIQAFLPLIRRGAGASATPGPETQVSRAGQPGRIVNMGSISGRLAAPFVGPYAASKFAVEALSDSLRLELRPWDVQVIVVEPGAIATPIWEKSISAAQDLARALPPAALERYGTASERLFRYSRRSGEAGLPPEAVARAVAHALTAPRPKTRYLVGADARIQALVARLVPDRLRDALIARMLGLPSRPS